VPEQQENAQQENAEPGTGRRSVLKSALVLGAAAPLAGGLTGARAATAGRRAPAGRSKAADRVPARGAAGAQGLSSKQLAGQRVIYSYSGLTVPSLLLTKIGNGEAAGVIFFGGNISSETQIASVIDQLVAAQQQSPIPAPLLLMTDQEGGLVRRLPGAPVQSEKQIGASSNPTAAASAAGMGAGQNLAGVGMNVNLAPVLDVFYKPGNFIDEFQRSYSNRPDVVRNCGQAFITAQQPLGVAATAKHFPGLGSAAKSQNTDLGPVTLNVSRTELRSKDEKPYPNAIAAGVDLIMASWAIYPALDPNLPAGLSPRIIQHELRSRLAYQGVTITDAIEAGALTKFGTSAQRSVLAAEAGMDVMLCSIQDPGQGRSVVNALAGALDSGQLNAADFTAAVARVTALRNSLP
jgi:beta-N-acetylhexosaminidase